MNNRQNIIIEEADVNHHKRQVFHDNKEGFHLSVSVRMTLRGRLIEIWNQHHQRSDQDHVYKIEDKIHQDCPGACDQKDQELRGSKADRSEERDPHGEVFNFQLFLLHKQMSPLYSQSNRPHPRSVLHGSAPNHPQPRPPFPSLCQSSFPAVPAITFARTLSCACFSNPSSNGSRSKRPYLRSNDVFSRKSQNSGFFGRIGPWL